VLAGSALNGAGPSNVPVGQSVPPIIEFLLGDGVMADELIEPKDPTEVLLREYEEGPVVAALPLRDGQDPGGPRGGGTAGGKLVVEWPSSFDRWQGAGKFARQLRPTTTRAPTQAAPKAPHRPPCM
jgi:hypothetical protein